MSNIREMAGQGGRNEPQLPFSTAPINWREPLAFKFNQLRAVSDAATRAGYRTVRLKVIAGGYEAQFQPDRLIIRVGGMGHAVKGYHDHG